MFPPVYNQVELERGGRVGQRVNGRNGDIDGSGLRQKQTRALLGTGEQTDLTLNACNSRAMKTVGVALGRSQANKTPKKTKQQTTTMCSVPWNLTYGTAKTELADVASPQNGLIFWKQDIPMGEVYGDMTPLWMSRPTIHGSLSLPPACCWWAAIIFTPPLPDRCL